MAELNLDRGDQIANNAATAGNRIFDHIFSSQMLPLLIEGLINFGTSGFSSFLGLGGNIAQHLASVNAAAAQYEQDEKNRLALNEENQQRFGEMQGNILSSHQATQQGLSQEKSRGSKSFDKLIGDTRSTVGQNLADILGLSNRSLDAYDNLSEQAITDINRSSRNLLGRTKSNLRSRGLGGALAIGGAQTASERNRIGAVNDWRDRRQMGRIGLDQGFTQMGINQRSTGQNALTNLGLQKNSFLSGISNAMIGNNRDKFSLLNSLIASQPNEIQPGMPLENVNFANFMQLRSQVDADRKAAEAQRKQEQQGYMQMGGQLASFGLAPAIGAATTGFNELVKLFSPGVRTPEFSSLVPNQMHHFYSNRELG